MELDHDTHILILFSYNVNVKKGRAIHTRLVLQRNNIYLTKTCSYFAFKHEFQGINLNDSSLNPIM